MNWTTLGEIDNFLYLGALVWVDDTEKENCKRMGCSKQDGRNWEIKDTKGTKSKILLCKSRKCDNVRCRKLDSN